MPADSQGTTGVSVSTLGIRRTLVLIAVLCPVQCLTNCCAATSHDPYVMIDINVMVP